MLMKFSNGINQNLKIILITILLTFTMSVRFGVRQTGLEQQTITISIFNNATEYMTSNEVQIKMIQNEQEFNGTNRFVGYWEMKIQGAHQNITPHNFNQEIPNFGRMIDSKMVHIDFRYILGCNFEVKEESNNFKVIFRMISKESTSQHVFGIEFIVKSAGNNLDDVKKYFDSINKICKSTQETANLMKGQLANILSENLVIKRKSNKKMKNQASKILDKLNSLNDKIDQSNSSDSNTPKNSSIGNVTANSNSTKAGFVPAESQDKINSNIDLDDIEDPNVKNTIKKFQDIIKNEKDNLNKAQITREKLLKRANELMDRLDKDNQQLSVIEPKYEENLEFSKSANLTIDFATKNITNLTLINQELNQTLHNFITNKTLQDAKVKTVDTQHNNMKADLNKNTDDANKLKKALADVEAKANVDTETLANIEDKKKELISKINELNSEIKKDQEDVESNENNLKLVQTNFNNLEQEIKKLNTQIDELNNQMKELMKKENDIKKQIDPKVMTTLETQKQNVVTQLSESEKTLLKSKDAVMALIDPQYGEMIKRAYAEITNKDNFDAQSYEKILKEIPPHVWQIPS